MPIADHCPQNDTFCGRVVQFFSADIVGPEIGAIPRSYDLARVEWICEYQTPQNERRPTELWTGQKLCYEPEKTWTDIVEVDRILGPEPVVPYSRWPTIPHSEAKHKGQRFMYGKADVDGRPGTGSAMYVRQGMLRRLARVLPERIPGVARGSATGRGFSSSSDSHAGSDEEVRGTDEEGGV